jgi:RHS repeat-associated protein
VARFVFGSNPLVPDYFVKSGATYRIISDHLGSPRLVVDTATGAVVQGLGYDEFGNVTLDTNPGFQPFGFAGGLYDSDTGLLRFGSRDYASDAGRWLRKDPGGFSDGTNLYSYTGADPINFVDPTGLDRYEPCAGCSNFVESFICRAAVDRACRASPQICCKADMLDCALKAEDEYAEWACYVQEGHCNITAGLQPPPPPKLQQPPGAEPYPFPPATAGRTKNPDPRFEQLLNAEGELR